MDHQNDPFESNIVPSNNSSNFGDNFVLRELIGKLGSICNSGEISPNSFVDSNNNSCYTTPLNSPPRLNLSNFPNNSTHFSADLGFLDRASKLPCFGSSNNLGATNESEFGNRISRNKYIKES
ncbi:hypothetical protein HAX54_026027 [Datura stramonium]|uniref:Uncharacterized protein n=1 Tax=Datura stramonium TaxID=4076 RepID=A0ABS8V2P8_DATST|nr:hypothetical protein [Datura stramonium]